MYPAIRAFALERSARIPDPSNISARNVVASTGAVDEKDGGISKWKLAIGAASLFFFVVGVKRSFRTEEGHEISQRDADGLADGEDAWPWGVPPERFGELEERRDDEPRRDGAAGSSA